MIRLAVSVEGQTEEEFVKRVLGVHLRGRRIEATPIVLGRARSRAVGGSVSVDRLVSEVVTLCGSFDAVTTLVDFYGFRDKANKAVQELEVELLDRIAGRIGGDWNARMVVPYVQRHEFEGVLFSDVDVFATQIDFPRGCVAVLRAVREQFATPEDINDNYDTAPSRRIGSVIPRYDKRLHGSILAEEIGLDRIRAECPRFDAWVTRLESLGAEQLSRTVNATT